MRGKNTVNPLRIYEYFNTADASFPQNKSGSSASVVVKGWSDQEILEFASACAVMALGKADATSGLITETEIKDYCKQFVRKNREVPSTC